MGSTDTSRTRRVREYMLTAEFARLWRYASVSVISTVLSLSLLFLFFNVAKLPSAAVSNLLATSITSIPAYYLNRTWAWGKTGRSHIMREVVPFWVISIISIILSTEAVHFASDEAHHVTHTHMIVTLIVLAANFGTYAVLWVAKFMFFNRVLFKGRDPHDEDVDDSDGTHSGIGATTTETSSAPINTAQAFTRVDLKWRLSAVTLRR